MTTTSEPVTSTPVVPVADTVQLLRDEQAVRDLGYRFADACNRDDTTAFRALWAADGVWIIDDPINIRAEGGDTIASTRAALRQGWDFFVQLPSAPVVTVDGDRATSTWTVCEHANNAAGQLGYHNYARYDDQLTRTPDGWRYLCRHYRYYHLDQTPLASSAPTPPAPTVDPAPLTRGPGIH
jgi:hypothetical protein